MPTKCIVIGECPKEVTRKPIKFEQVMSSGLRVSSSMREPNEFDNVELVCRAYGTSGKSIMFAYNTGNRCNGVLYFGHWNDGVVE